VALNFTQPIIDTATEIATGSSADLAVIISGPDLNQLRTLAAQTLQMLKTVPGAVDTSIEQERDQAQLRIAVDRYQVARYGINVGDVQHVIDLAIGGNPITTVFEGDRHFDVVTRLVPEARATPEAIGNLLIPVRDGARVPLSQLADIRVVDGASIILRRENERAIAVRTNIRGRDQGGFVADAQTRSVTAAPQLCADQILLDASVPIRSRFGWRSLGLSGMILSFGVISLQVKHFGFERLCLLRQLKNV
jgi:cobalt-zinc-cadmium resistance protein CzcA